MEKNMKVALTTKEVASGVLGNLFETYKSSHLNSNSPYESYLTVANDFLKELPPGSKQEILSSKYDIEGSMDDFASADISAESKYDFILGFDNFVATVKNAIEEYEPKFLNFDGLQRQYAPPLEVFKYVGHNELDISQSKTGYSLLFD